MPGKFELYKDVGGRFRFRLLGENGERVLISDGFARKVLALEAIVSVLKTAPEATLIDLTVAGNGEIQLTEHAPVADTPPEREQEREAQPVPAPRVVKKAPVRKKAAAKKRVARPATPPPPEPAPEPATDKKKAHKAKHGKKKSKKRKGKKNKK
jgi:hypothetical protein